jgi:hypothetical protein
VSSMEPDIESIAGHLAIGQDSILTSFIVTYSGGHEDHLEGTLLDASVLASTQDLIIVPAPSGSFRWVRNPGTGLLPAQAAP